MPVIVIEGIDGAGKTSLAKLLAWRLRNLRKPVQFFSEPGGTHLADEVRHLVAETENPAARFFLFLASRSDLCAHVRNLQTENPRVWILLDRFSPSTFAYQSFVDARTIEEADRVARQGVRPDVVLWLDIPVDLALSRCGNRRRAERSATPEYENAEVLQLAASTYRRLYDADQASARIWQQLDAQRPLDEIVDQVINRLVVLFATGRLSDHA